MNPLAVCAAIAASACAMSAAGVWLHLVDARSRGMKARVQATARAHGPASSAGPREAAASLARADRSPVLGARLSRLLNVQPDRPELYPLPWWVVLLGSLVAALLVTAPVTRIVSPLAWALLPGLVLAFARPVFGFFHARRMRLLYRQMPDALSMIVRSVRAGIPVSEALRTVGREAPAPTNEEFVRLYADLSIGRTLDAALREMSRRTGLQEYGFFAVALALQGQTGGNLTDALENLADVIRKRLALRARGMALSAEARSTAMVLAALPFVVFAMLAVVNPSYIMLLFTTRRGEQLLIAGIASLVTGIGSMQLIIRKSLS